jgi:hypothetical protein
LLARLFGGVREAIQDTRKAISDMGKAFGFAVRGIWMVNEGLGAVGRVGSLEFGVLDAAGAANGLAGV